MKFVAVVAAVEVVALLIVVVTVVVAAAVVRAFVELFDLTPEQLPPMR